MSVRKHLLLRAVAASTVLLAVACSPSGAPEASSAVVALALAPAQAQLAQGTGKTFHALAWFPDGTTADVSGDVAWSTLDASIADLGPQPGRVQALSPGWTMVEAVHPSGSTARAPVLVTPAELTSLAVTPGVASLALGTAQQLSAIGTFSDGTLQDLTDAVAWSSSAAALAVSNAEGSQGLCSALAIDDATVTALHAQSGVNGTAQLGVTAAELLALAVTPTAPTLAKGVVVALRATGTFTDATVQDLTDTVQWSSADELVALVSDLPGTKGLATALASGGSLVTATHAATGLVGSTPLKVSTALLSGLQVEPDAASIALGTLQAFTATGTFSDGTVQDLTGSVLWSSSSLGVASIASLGAGAGQAASLAQGLTTITARHPASGILDSSALSVTPALLTSIAVSPTTPAIALGTLQQFTATGTYTDATTQDLTSLVTWSSDDPLVALLSNLPGTNGLALSLTEGPAVVSALHPSSGVSGATTLTVTPAVLSSLSITPAIPSIALGLLQQFTATGTYTDGTTQDLTDAVTWSSSLLGVAAISNALGSKGLATSLGVGTTTIGALDPGSGIDDSTALAITPAVLELLQVTPSASSLALGLLQQFTATGVYSDATTQDLTEAVTWSSSLPGIATISNALGSAGLATGLGIGTSTIGALHPASGLNDSTAFSITPAVLQAIQVAPTAPSVALGLLQQFQATGVYSDGTTQDLTDAVTWSSSLLGVAAISNVPGSEGLATSLGIGSSTIGALHPASGLGDSTQLSITAAVLQSLEVTPAAPSLALGLLQQFTATGVYSDATTQDLTDAVTWSSSLPGIATVSNALGSEGLATSLGLGTTAIGALHPASGLSDSAALSITAAVLNTLQITPSIPSIPLGTVQQFTATGVYTDATTQDLTDVVTWTSSLLGVATVSNVLGNKGLATSLALGTTTVGAVDPTSGLDDSTTLQVSAAVLESLLVSPSTPSVTLGLLQQFSATGVYSDGSTQDLTESVSWSSSLLGIATISNVLGTKGLATALGLGSTTIGALHPGSGLSDDASLSITAALLLSIDVAPVDPTVALGSEQAFTATGNYSDLSSEDLTDSVLWSSSATSVATISNAGGSQGVAQAAAVGSSTITATHPGSGLSDATTLTVSAATLVSLAVAPADAELSTGSTLAYTATGTYSDASTQDLTTSVTWSSSNTAALTISNAGGSQGLATGVAEGSATVTALHPSSGISGATGAQVVSQITLRSTSSAGVDAGSLSISLPTPTGVVAGDVLVAALAVTPATTLVTAPLGWTLIRRTDNLGSTSNSLLAFRRVAGASEPADHDFSLLLCGGAAGGIAAFVGVDGSSPVVTHSGANTASSLAHASPSIVPSTADTMLVTLHAFASTATWTPPAGLNEGFEEGSEAAPSASGVSLELCYAHHAPAGSTGSHTATAANNADAGNAQAIALRKAP